MIQARWDVILQFVSGPLAMQGDITCRGPVVRMGASPGPGGLNISAYRGLDSVQCTITAYDGVEVSITPMGTNQVRVAPHANVDWSQIQTLRGPVYLSPGAVVHLGAPNRGATFVYVRCQRFVWQQQQLISEAAQGEDTGFAKPTNIKEIDTQRGIPRWFIPAVAMLFMATAASIAGITIVALQKPTLRPGPKFDEEIEYFLPTEKQLAVIDRSELEGFEQAFEDFVMRPNADASGDTKLQEPSQWDKQLVRYTKSSFVGLAQYYQFWRDLERLKDDYRSVVDRLTEAGMPSVFAAIPYQESKYKAEAKSYVCAKGYWQFMPETAKRVGLTVRDCHFYGSGALWSPDKSYTGSYKKAPYYDAVNNKCRISQCDVDERTDLVRSTEGAIALLREAWDNPTAQQSGALVQMAILAHNAGFDDSRHNGGKLRYNNVLIAYKKHLEDQKVARDPSFYGKNITCNPQETDPHKAGTDTTYCGGRLPNQTQHYGYSIIAQHLLAVCYYATNYPDRFPEWEVYTEVDGYCQTALSVPSRGSFSK